MPKIIGATLADHRELTRQRLFDALSDLLADKPFDTITMSEIAERAGVGRTAVYNHFADKESLLLAFMRQTTTEFARVLQTALGGQDDPIEQLRIYIRAYLELKEHFHLASSVGHSFKLSAATAEHLHDHAGIVEHVLFHILESAMIHGRIPQQNSLALVALIHSTLAGQFLPDETDEREESIQLVQAFILRGIGAAATEAPLPPSPVVTPGHEGEPVVPRRDAQAFLRCPVVGRL